MNAEERSFEVARNTARLLKAGILKGAELDAAERSVRQLVDPLRMLILGSDPQMAVSLLNLALGERIIPKSMRGVQIQFSQSSETFANLQFRDGSKKRIPASEFSDLLQENPVKIRIGANLPVLSKISIMVIANSNARKLTDEVEKISARSDFAFWVAGDLPRELRELWTELPDRLRQHSYLIRNTAAAGEQWAELEDEFVDVMTVDAEAALTAKSAPGGADKEAFKTAGGMGFVKCVKSEIDMLQKAALDTADMLLIRHAKVLEEPTEAAEKPAKKESSDAVEATTVQPVEPINAADNSLQKESVPEPAEARLQDKPSAEPIAKSEPKVPPVARDTSAASDPTPADVDNVQPRRPASSVSTRPRSVPASKVKTVSRVRSRPTKPPLPAEDVLPKRPIRPSRPRSRPIKSRPGATPWSLGL